jgi:hypothetical protein
MSVPNTNTFTLQDVCNEIYGSYSGWSLSDCFADSNANGFDASYEGSHDRLSNFRNYTHVTRSFSIWPPSSTIYDQYGNPAYPKPNYYITTNEYWYSIVDNSEIGNLALTWGYGSGSGYTEFNAWVYQNYDSFQHAGGAAFYYSSDDSWCGSVGVCQDGYYYTCN